MLCTTVSKWPDLIQTPGVRLRGVVKASSLLIPSFVIPFSPPFQETLSKSAQTLHSHLCYLLLSELCYPTMNHSTELTLFHDESDTIPLRKTYNPAEGKARAKPLLDSIDLLAVLASVATLIAAICVITPDWRASWQLGFENQIIVIGFLLSLMNLCMRRVAPTLFLILEARWGNSRLQNYEALLKTSITLPHTQLIWRATLLSLILLPLGLSAAYKRFVGGHSTRRIFP